MQTLSDKQHLQLAIMGHIDILTSGCFGDMLIRWAVNEIEVKGVNIGETIDRGKAALFAYYIESGKAHRIECHPPTQPT